MWGLMSLTPPLLLSAITRQAHFIFIRSDDQIAINGDPQTSVDISFNRDSVFAGQPVLVTLAQIGQIVTETLDAFEGLIAAQP